MPIDSRAALAVLLATSTLSVAACSSDTTPHGEAAAAAALPTARIYVIAPQTGGDSALGVGMTNSVRLAVQQAQSRGDIPGWKLDVVALDDKGDKPTARQMAQKAAADPATVAVVGSIFSGLTKETLAVLGPAKIPQVSPTATNPALTKGADYDARPRRQATSFFRVIAPDDAHAPALARYLREHDVSRAAVVHDGDDYGKGLAAAFTAAFTKAGGKIVMTGTLDPKAPAVYPALVKKIAAAKPQAVLFGGNDGPGGALSGQLKEIGVTVPVVGGDALATDMYIPKAGALASGDLSTAAGKPVAEVKAGKQYLDDYENAGFAESPTSYGPLGYDAANAVLAALRTSLKGAGSTQASRPATIEALAGVSFDGTNGHVAFDRYGDITPRVVTVNVLTGGHWKPAQTFDLG